MTSNKALRLHLCQVFRFLGQNTFLGGRLFWAQRNLGGTKNWGEILPPVATGLIYAPTLNWQHSRLLKKCKLWNRRRNKRTTVISLSYVSLSAWWQITACIQQWVSTFTYIQQWVSTFCLSRMYQEISVTHEQEITWYSIWQQTQLGLSLSKLKSTVSELRDILPNWRPVLLHVCNPSLPLWGNYWIHIEDFQFCLTLSSNRKIKQMSKSNLK